MLNRLHHPLEESSSAMAPLVSPAARRYALLLLFCAYVVNYVDRQVITILQDPIKADLGLTDGQLGLVTGLSFALFYAVLGVPIARVADRRSRRTIIAVSMTLWSGMTALCATAGSFGALLLYRVGVGVGEAGLTPPAHSLISDYYPPERRATALAIYSAAGTVGVMAGFLAGGWINEFFGWRIAILAVGAPGLVLALLVRFTMREPRRGQYDQPDASIGAQDAGMHGIGSLWRNRAFRCLVLGAGFHTFVTYGQGNWAAPFFGRVHGMSTGELGTWMAALSIGPGFIGMILSGWFSDWLAQRRPQGRLEVGIVSIALMIPFEVGVYLSSDRYMALAMSAGSFFLAGVYLAPAIAAAHAMVSPRLRATSSAVLLLGINLIGLGLGPLVAGMLSDRFVAMGMGAQSLRWALFWLIPAQLVAVFLFVRARHHSVRMGMTA